MKSEVRFLHKFLKSIGFSEYTTTRKIQELGTPVHFIPSFDEIETFILENCMRSPASAMR